MSLEILMSRAHMLAIHPSEYEMLREKWQPESSFPQLGSWWSASFNGIQIIPDDRVAKGEILVCGVRNGKLVTIGKIISVEE